LQALQLDARNTATGPRAAAFSPDGKWIAAGANHVEPRGFRIKAWDAATGREVRASPEIDGAAIGVAFSPDGATLAAFGEGPGGGGGAADLLVLWERAGGGEAVRVLAGHSGPVTRAAFTPDGRRLVSISDDGTARIWDLAGGGGSRVLRGSLLSTGMSGLAV